MPSGSRPQTLLQRSQANGAPATLRAAGNASVGNPDYLHLEMGRLSFVHWMFPAALGATPCGSRRNLVNEGIRNFVSGLFASFARAAGSLGLSEH